MLLHVSTTTATAATATSLLLLVLALLLLQCAGKRGPIFDQDCKATNLAKLALQNGRASLPKTTCTAWSTCTTCGGEVEPTLVILPILPCTTCTTCTTRSTWGPRLQALQDEKSFGHKQRPSLPGKTYCYCYCYCHCYCYCYCYYCYYYYYYYYCHYYCYDYYYY